MNTTNNSIEENDYPNSPFIKYINKGFISSNFTYEVINIGHYPENHKVTHGSSYPIPDAYKIKTTFGKVTIICSIYYNDINSPVYQIEWSKDNENLSITSTKSATEATDLFLKAS